MDTVLKTGLLAAVSVVAVSCISRYNVEEYAGAIAFRQIEAETKAIVNGPQLPSGSSFRVWGGYSSANNVFNGIPVTENSGVWSYGDDLRFWEFGETYSFHAVYPAETGTDMSVSDDGTITVTSFDCSKTGADAVDLMTAAKTGIKYNEGEKPQPVALTFRHELARLVFVVKNHSGSQGITGYDPKIYSAKLYGMYKFGDMSLKDGNASWTGSTVTDAVSPLVSWTGETSVTESGVSVTEALLFPQLIGSGYYFILEYSSSGSTRKTATIQLSSLPLTEWKAGKQYRYSFTIAPDDRILFDKPAVDEWDEAEGGIIIVD